MAEVPSAFGPYVLLKQLGTGGGGDVYLAKPRSAQRGIPAAVVIKRLHGNLAAESDFVRRFRHEAEIAVSVQSPHIVKCYDAGIVSETFYIAMEYVAGWTLGRMIKEAKKANRAPSLHSVRDIIGGALMGLEALHGAKDPNTGEALSIIHRDIAPKNIMVGEDGVTRLIDLGIGKSSLQDWKTGTGVIMGSPGYMAPEQVAGQKIDHRVDIYAMGIVLWEFLTLRAYFERATFAALLRAQHKPVYTPPSQIVPGLPPALDEVCRRALQVDREHRYSTAAEMLQALRAAIPPREEADEQPLATIVGEMLVGELGRSKTEVFRLLSAAPAPMPVVQDVVVLAHAAGVAEGHLAEDPQEENLLPTLTGPDEVAAFPGEGVAYPTPPYSVAVVPSNGVPLKIVAPLLLLTLIAGVGGTALVLTQNKEPVQVVEQSIVAEPRSTPKVGVESKAVPEAVQVEEKAAVEVVQPAEASRRIKAPVRTDTPSTEPVVEQPAPSPQVDPKVMVNALIARVRAVRSKAAAGTPAALEATRLMTKLSLESARPDLDAAKAANLEGEVRALEAL